MATMGATTSVVDVDENEQLATAQSGDAQLVTILMPVDASTAFDHTIVEDGATADEPLPMFPPGRSAVAVESGQLVASIGAADLEPNTGDTTEDLLPARGFGDQPREVAVQIVVEETRVVDLGRGIVVGELSVNDFNEVLSFPKLSAIGGEWVD